MWYAIFGRDAQGSLPARLAHRTAHRERIQTMRDEGRLLLAGPLPAIDAEDPGPAGFAGSLIVAEFDSLQDAIDWAQADPYVISGVYGDIDVFPFVKVMP